MWFVHFHCCTRRGWVHCAEQSRNEHLYRCRPVIFLRFTDRRESIGWHSLSKREDGPPNISRWWPIVFRIESAYAQRNMFDKCLADCLPSLSLIRVNEFLLLLTHFTLVYVCRLVGEQGPVLSLLE